MKEDSVLKRMITSLKFWTMILGGIATAGATFLAKYGLELSDAAIQQIAGSIVVLTSILVHAQGQADQGKNATGVTTQVAETINNPPATAPPKAATTAPVVALVMLIGLSALLATSPGCGGSNRNAQLRTAMISLTVAKDALVAFDHEHKKQILAASGSDAEFTAKFAAYKAKRELALDAFSVAITAIAAAAVLESDDKSLIKALATVGLALKTWTDLKGDGP